MFDAHKFLARALLASAAFVLLAAGCGVSQYNQLMNRRLARLRGEVKFRHLYAATELPGVPISIRLPMVFGDSYQANSAHEDDGATINPDRLQPPFLKLPGFKLCYEGTNTTGNTTLPFYCYIAAQPAQPGAAEKLANQLQAQLQQAFPAKADADPQPPPVEWTPIDADTPSGFNIHWRKIRVEGEQPFFVKNGDQLQQQNTDGVFELWIHDADDYVVLVGWRTPKSIEGASPSAGTGAKTIETLLQGPPDDAKLDMTEMPAATAGTLSIEKQADS